MPYGEKLRQRSYRMEHQDVGQSSELPAQFHDGTARPVSHRAKLERSFCGSQLFAPLTSCAQYILMQATDNKTALWM